ncbi:MAG: alkane 1-monooxygenase [Xanthobacteraceae bacterium]
MRSEGIALRFGLANLLLAAGIAAILIGGWAIVVVALIAILAGGPVDEAAGDDEAPVGSAGRSFYAANLYATAPLIALLTIAFLVTVRRLPPESGAAGFALQFFGGAFLMGYLYALVGVTVAHELTHWTQYRVAQQSARILLAFTFNTTFTIYHVHGHHRTVAQYDDAATARRGEHVFAFLLRTTIWQFREAFTYEAERMRRANRSPWSLHNRAINGQLYSIAMLLVAWTIAGLLGVLAFLGAALVGRFIHELMNYVQHYGLVRVEGAPVESRHTWDCYRLISNALQYNLPRHSQHHMFASQPFWNLPTSDKAPKLPHGYQTMAMLALIGPLWRRTMAPLLADWDRNFASEAERELVRQRGWLDRA